MTSSTLPNLGLSLDNAKSRYSLAFLSAVCAQAGAAVYETRQDEDCWAIDARVEVIGGDVAVQLKCTESPNRTDAGIRIDLTDGWIAKWAAKTTPVYVVGVVVPKDQNLWVQAAHEFTIHNTVAYWGRFDRDSSAKSIVLPYDQRLTVSTLAAWDDDYNACFEGGSDD